MIRRRSANDFLLIAQHDHALIAGGLARRIGGHLFAPPAPRDEVLLACSQHDCGWPQHDDRPTLNPEGLPLDVFETPLPLALSLWSGAAERVMAQSDYAGLLVSLHVLALSAFAATHPHTPREVFELNKFQHRQIERLEKVRGKLGLRTDVPLHLGLAAAGASEADDRLAYNFSLLQLVDRLSLNLCCAEVMFPEIADVRPGPGKRPVTLRVRLVREHELCVTPWPFDEPEMLVEVPHRAVSDRRWSDVEELRSAHAQSPVQRLSVRLRA